VPDGGDYLEFKLYSKLPAPRTSTTHSRTLHRGGPVPRRGQRLAVHAIRV
jgi:hypothetical protein